MIILEQAKQLKKGDYVYALNGKRYKVSSVRTWKRDLSRIEVRARYGLYEYARINEYHLKYFSMEPTK